MTFASERKNSLSDAAPWLSVIIPIYNAKRTLKKCVRSVLMQSFGDFELLLIDDGSTDGSDRICRRYAERDPRVRFFRKENRGCFQSRIYGMERARGEYILTCDADDYYRTKDAFAILREKALEYSPDLLQFCHVRKHRIRTELPERPEKTAVVGRGEFVAKEYVKLFCPDWKSPRLSECVWRKLYRRSLTSALPPSETAERIFHGEDTILNLHLLENVQTCVFIPDRLYAYRLFGGTKRFLPLEMVSVDLTKKYQLRFLERWGSPEEQDRVRESMFNYLARRLLRFAIKGEGTVSDEELIRLISEALDLPRIRLARQFFLEHPEQSQWPSGLLCRADPQEYLEKARAENREHRFKKKIRGFVDKF